MLTMLTFLTQINNKHGCYVPCIILVHHVLKLLLLLNSDWIQRSGTYIAYDMLKRNILNLNRDDILHCLEQLKISGLETTQCKL